MAYPQLLQLCILINRAVCVFNNYIHSLKCWSGRTKRQISWGGAFKIHLTSIICTHEWKIHEAEIFFVVVVSWYFCIPGSRLVIQRVLSSSVPLLSFFYGGIWWLYGGMGKSTGLAGRPGRPGLALCPDLPSWSLPSISVSLRGGWNSPRAASLSGLL